MGASSIPFNITLLELTPSKLVGLKPVTKLDIFDGSGTNFNEDGLFSVSIFGRIGDDARSKRYSYIDIKIPIFHPVIYRALGQLKRFYLEILSNKAYATWNDEIKDFEKSTAIDGQTGFQFFVDHWKDIQFSQRESDIRNLNINLIEKFKDKAMLDKVLVMPAGMRDVEIQGDGQVSMDDINNLYKKVLAYANNISPVAVKNNPEILNQTRYSMQLAFNEIFDFIESLIEGKKKLLMGKWASRRIFNGTRNVITSMNINSNELDSPGNIGMNDTLVGLYQFAKGALPLTKYHLKNGFLSKVFSGPNSPAKLVNKETLRSESVNLKPMYYDAWMTEEGLEKVITAFGEETVRHKELEIEGYYIGLLYKSPEGFIKIVQDIEEVPATLDRKNVAPITFCELLYLSVYHFANKLPAFVTRFPITGFGSIYPSMIHLKPTVKTQVCRLLNDNWEVDTEAPVVYEFPMRTSFVNSMSPHSTKLSGLTADFDGDVCSLNIVYSDESKSEVAKYLQSRKFYVGNDGKLNFGFGTDTVKFLMSNMTGEANVAI